MNKIYHKDTGDLKNIIIDIDSASRFMSEINSLIAKLRENEFQIEECVKEMDVFSSIVITENPKTASRKQKEGFLCIGLTEDNYFFEGAEYVVDSLREISLRFFEEALLHHIGKPVLIGMTERLLVREITEEDIEELWNISRQLQEKSIMFQDEDCFQPEIMRAYIKTAYRFYGYGLYCVCRKNGERIGCCGFGQPISEYVQLQYMLKKEAWGKGYASEMCEVVIAYAKDFLELEGLELHIHKENVQSQKLAQRMGFQRYAGEDKVYLGYRKIF